MKPIKSTVWLITTLSLLAGCSSLGNSSESALIVEKEVQPLSRTEVITGINECEAAGLRPTVISTRRKINNQMTPTIVEVTCLPKLK
jgi:hypothetical protein